MATASSINRAFEQHFENVEKVARRSMVKSVAHMVAYGNVDAAFVKELNSKREAKEGIYFLHPPRGGFKKSSKVATPKGILGRHEDIVKLAGRML